jgi:hypothetical protein
MTTGSRHWRAASLALALLLTVGGCGGELQTPGEALRIFGESLPRAFAGEPYSAPVRAVGGLRPFSYQLRDGALPPGLDIQNGIIQGVPTELGTFQFTVGVSDANLSRTFQEYTLLVVERPPPELLLVLPQTEVREPITVRVRVRNASELRAASIRFSWDPDNFELVDGSVDAAGGGAVLWRSDDEALQADVAALGDAWSGELPLLSFVLAPKRPSVPDVDFTALVLDDRGGRHFQESSRQSARPAAEAGGDPVGADPDGSEPPEDAPEGESEGDL